MLSTGWVILCLLAAYLCVGWVVSRAFATERHAEAESLMDDDRFVEAATILQIGPWSDGLLWPLEILAWVYGRIAGLIRLCLPRHF